MYRALQDWPTSLRTATSCCTWPADCRSCWTSPLRSWIAEAEMNQGQGGAGVGRNLSPSAETCITSNKTSWTRLVLIYFAVGRNIGHHVLVSLSCWPQSCRCQSMLEGWGMLKSRVSRVIVSRVSQFIVGWGDILDLREVNWGVVGVEDNIGVECEVGNIGILVARSNSLMLTFISLVIMRWARVRSCDCGDTPPQRRPDQRCFWPQVQRRNVWYSWYFASLILYVNNCHYSCLTLTTSNKLNSGTWCSQWVWLG